MNVEELREVLLRPGQEFVVAGAAGDVVTEPPVGQAHHLGAAASAPFTRRQRDRLGVQPGATGHEHTGLLGQWRAAGQCQRHHRGGGDRDGGGRSGTLGREVTDQRRQPWGRHREHHGIGRPALPVVVDHVPPALRRHQGAHPDLRPAQTRATHQLVEQHGVATVDGAEHRPRGRGRQRRGDGLGEVARTAVQRGGHRRRRRANADGGGRAGVHPGQQRVDRADDDLLTETVADEFGHRRVGPGTPRERPAGFVTHPPDGRVVHQAHQGVRPRRDAVDGVLGQWVQAVFAVDQRARPGGGDLFVGHAQLGQQRRHLGSAGHEGLGPHVQRLPGDAFRAQDATEPVSGIEYGDRSVRSSGHP